MIRRALAGLALLAACDGDPAMAPPDAAVLDAGPPPEVLLTSGPRTLTASADGARLALRDADGVLIDDLTVAITLAGRRLSTEAWPARSWTVGDGRAVGRFPAADGLPALTWTLSLTERALTSQVRVSGAGPEVPLERTESLVAETPGWAGARARPATGPGWTDAAEARPDRQWLWADRVLEVHADGPVTISVAPLTVYDRRPTQRLGRGHLDSATTTLRFAPATPAATAPDVWGWRSADWGSGVNRQLVLRQAEALTERDAGAALLSLDGLWYAAPGDARGGLPFPGGLAALAEAIEPARLAAVWPLHAAPDAPLVLDHATAELDETPRCGRPACVRLDPRVPAVRAATARALAATPFERVWLIELPDPAQTGTDALHTLAAEVSDGAQLDATLAQPEGWPLDDPCRGAATVHPWPAGCAASLATAHQAAPRAPRAVDALGWRLLDAVAPTDLGPVRIVRPAGEARIAVALAWLSGGPRLVGDDLAALDDAQWTLAGQLWGHHPGPGAPVEMHDTHPPAAWRLPAGHAWIAWDDAPLTVTTPPGGPWRDLLRPGAPELAAGAAVVVPARDAVVLVGPGVAAGAGRFTGARGTE